MQTGRWTLRLLAATLAITPLRRLTGWNWLIKYRRPLGLFAFFYACVHVLTYLWLDYGFIWHAILDDIVEHKRIIFGLIAFLSLVPLALTSTKGWIRRLGKKWARLHMLIYLSAIAGTIHFLWSVKRDISAPLTYLAIFLVLFAYRIYIWRRGKSPRRVPAARNPASFMGADERG